MRTRARKVRRLDGWNPAAGALGSVEDEIV